MSDVCEAMFDRDRSGSIELHEFQALWTYIGQWRQVFDQYDRDRSGSIDGSELHNSKFIFITFSAAVFQYKHLPAGIVGDPVVGMAHRPVKIVNGIISSIFAVCIL